MNAAQLRAQLAGKKPRPARRTRHQAGQMNNLEAEYLRTMLEPRQLTGEVTEIKFESVKLRLADNTFYTPDFSVASDCLEIHEVKGHWEDDARVKWKVTAELYPEYRFFAATKRKKSDGGGFNVEEYGKLEHSRAKQGNLGES